MERSDAVGVMETRGTDPHRTSLFSFVASFGALLRFFSEMVDYEMWLGAASACLISNLLISC